MRFFIGFLIVILCVGIGYVAMGGYLGVLWQPFEFVIIVGAAIGALVINTEGAVLGKIPSGFVQLLKGGKFHKKDYLELLTLLFYLIKFIKSKGLLGLEGDIDKPQESTIFKKFPHFINNKKAVEFLCDYLRMLSMGCENPHQMDSVMEEELEVYGHELKQVGTAFQQMSDGMPALGIVAAVLGVIHTMGSINQPPEVLGHLIGGALVGTFAGVLISYGLIGPIAQALLAIAEGEIKYYMCIRAGLLAHLNGYPPLIAVEYARKSIEEHTRPAFIELEEAVSNLTDI